MDFFFCEQPIISPLIKKTMSKPITTSQPNEQTEAYGQLMLAKLNLLFAVLHDSIMTK